MAREQPTWFIAIPQSVVRDHCDCVVEDLMHR
jgi:hypothetical protein